MNFVRLTNHDESYKRVFGKEEVLVEPRNSIEEAQRNLEKVFSMKKTVIFFVILAISGVFFELSVAQEEEQTKEERRYTTKYDNVDIDAIIKSERLLNAYVGCLLDRNPCTPDAMELKRNLPDALATNCSACSAAQKNAADKLSHYLIDERPDQWSLLEEKYDPDGSYRRSYQQNNSDEDKSD